MLHTMKTASLHNLALFDTAVYRNSNQDLSKKSDAECRDHFETSGKYERRVFGLTTTTHDRLSMRWLRGEGIEIGAGSTPINLYGHAERCFADSDTDLKFGGSQIDYVFMLDDPNLFSRVPRDGFDFAVASHVLEHVDSFLIGLQNLIRLVKPGGIVYAAVPSSEYDYDGIWMPYFDFQHHIDEFLDPLKYVRVHDDLVIDVYRRNAASGAGRRSDVFHDDEFYAALKQGRLSPAHRFSHHKHSYDYHGWTEMFIKSLEYLGHDARLVDAAFGEERMDCNFVFERNVTS